MRANIHCATHVKSELLFLLENIIKLVLFSILDNFFSCPLNSDTSVGTL